MRMLTIMEDTAAVVSFLPQERIQEPAVELPVDIVVHLVMEEITAVQFQRPERIPERIVGQPADIVERGNRGCCADRDGGGQRGGVSAFASRPHPRTNREAEVVNAPVPPNKEEIAEVLQPSPQEHFQGRVGCRARCCFRSWSQKQTRLEAHQNRQRAAEQNVDLPFPPFMEQVEDGYGFLGASDQTGNRDGAAALASGSHPATSRGA